jgi:hypothetical protein
VKITRELNVELNDIEIHTKSRLIVVRPRYWLDGEAVTLAQHLELDDTANKLITQLIDWVAERLL